MKASKTCSAIAGLALAIGALTACGGSASSDSSSAGSNEKITLKVGLFGAASDAGLILAKDKGYFDDENISVEFVPSQSAPTIISLVASGKLDAAGTSPTPGLFNAISTNVPVKIAADKGQIDPQHSWTGLVVKADGPSDITGLKGKRIGVPDINTATGSELGKLLSDSGMDVDDVKLVPGNPADTFVAFQNGSIDGAALQEPFIAQALAKGDAKVIKPFGEVLPNGQNGIVLFGEKLAKDKGAGKRFLAAYTKGVADYRAAFPASGEPVGRDDVVKSLIAATPVKQPEVYEKMQPVLFAPDGKVDTESIDYMQKFFVEIGTQKTVVSADDYLLDLD